MLSTAPPLKKISVIIPTYNEQAYIKNTINKLRSLSDNPIEIIVVDALSIDDTVYLVNQSQIRCISTNQKNRAHQMNIGAEESDGEILYFLHADTIPPDHFDSIIIRSLNSGISAGCFRLSFDSKHWFLSGLAFFTRFKSLWFRYGDQSLFLSKSVFNAVGGFKEHMRVMEDQDIISRLRKRYPFKIVRNRVTTSARSFENNGVYRLFFIYMQIFLLAKFGVSQEKLVKLYRKKINQGKV